MVRKQAFLDGSKYLLIFTNYNSLNYARKIIEGKSAMAITKIMVVDRDRDTLEQIESVMDSIGLSQIVFEPVKSKAIERIRDEKFNAVFFDPAPSTEELRAFVIGVRRDNKNYVPITVMSRQVQDHEAFACGANDFLPKPIDIEGFKSKVKNMKNLTDLITRLKDEHKDFVSRDGAISKSAFYQIFVSCLDRADRYGEETFLIFVRIDNIHDLEALYGLTTTEEICDKLKKYAVKIRRLSDVVGRTAMNELCLLIVRPMNQSEPLMAVNRFADSMMEYADMVSSGDAKAQISVHLMAVPSGKVLFSKECY